MENDESALAMTTFNINELIRLVLIAKVNQMEEKELDVQLQFEEESSLVRADRDQIEQVLINLLDNAVKFTPPCGQIHVMTAAQDTNTLSVTVQDNGIGILPQDIPYVFDRFYMADKAHTVGQGTGLGLAICKTIVEKHGQYIEVLPRENGTSIRFTLQRAKQDALPGGEQVKARAYAKVNWYLRVVGKRPDGYHELDMLMQHIDLYDELAFEHVVGEQIILAHEDAGTLSIPDEQNLIIKAARLLQRHAGISQGVRISCHKHIPTGAGLGGGSADAAATLLSLNRLWRLDFSLADLQTLSLPLGADIPYCLEEGPALVRGIGQRIEPISLREPPWLVILKPEQSLNTRDVFAHYAMHHSKKTIDGQKTIDALRRGEYGYLNDVCGNDLQQAAISLLPEIEAALGSLKAGGALYAQMSGSGSAVFGVFADHTSALAAWQSMRAAYHTCIITRCLERATAVL